MESVNDAVARPASRHISASLPEILEILRGRLSSSDLANFNTFSHLIEAFIDFEFLDLRRRIKWSFHLFSRGAMGKEYIGRLGRPLPPKADYISREKQFISDFITLMESAHYDMLTKELWDIALKEEFQLTMPLKVNMKVMDSKMLTRFWNERPEARQQLPEIANQILIFYRGISLSTKRDLFISEKINLFLYYTLLRPLKKLLRLEDETTTIPAVKEEEQENVVKRITLKQLLPDWRTVLQKFLSKQEIVEPTFDDVVVLYRKAKGQLLPSTPVNKNNTVQAKRNIVIKTFNSVPLADLEVIFPEKVVSLSNLSLVTMWVTLVVALVTAGMTIWQTDIDETVIISVLSLLLGKLFQSYTTMQKEKSTMMTNISKMLYDKTRDSQDGAVLNLLDDMADQQTKMLCLMYTLLLMSTQKTAPIGALEKSAKGFLKESFGLEVEFDLKQKKKALLSSGIIQEDPNNEENLIALSLEEAKQTLSDKWRDAYKTLDNLDQTTSFLGSVSNATGLFPAAVNGVGMIAGSLTKATMGTVSTTLRAAQAFKGGLTKRLSRRQDK